MSPDCQLFTSQKKNLIGLTIVGVFKLNRISGCGRFAHTRFLYLALAGFIWKPESFSSPGGYSVSPASTLTSLKAIGLGSGML